jgi:hypothetical protein
MNTNETLDYNTSRDLMVIPEYGRNVQNMITHCTTLTDAEERNKCAQAIIKVMGQLNPHLRDFEDYNHKLWAHLFIMSNFELDVESPYPRPSRESFTSKPQLIDYPHSRIKFGHYGRLAEEWIKAAVKLEEGEEKNELIRRLANMLKASYLLWNKDSVEDQVIIKNLYEMSGGKLVASEDVLGQTSEMLKNFRKAKRATAPLHPSKNRKKNFKKRN